MIGRQGEIRPFDLIRWARQQAVTHNLRTLEAHVLLLLATYANKDAIAWPSIKTLARQSGLRVYEDERGARNAAVSKAIARLEELGLLWTKQGGHGHPARRELLYNPAADPPSQPFAEDGGSSADTPAQPPASVGAEPPTSAGEKDHCIGQLNGQEETARGSLPQGREAASLSGEEAERETIRDLIDSHFASTEEAA